MAENNSLDVIRSRSVMPPAHYIVKIDFFSKLSKILLEAEKDNYESENFKASGYMWKLSLYPNGRKERNGDGYISLYLVIEDTIDMPLGWEVNVLLKMFVYNQIQDEYLTIQDGIGSITRFHAMKQEHGFSQLIPLNEFKNAENGYLVDDLCIFGAEVFVIKSTGFGECLSMLKVPASDVMTWKIENFSKVDEETIWSHVFKRGQHKWNLSISGKIKYKECDHLSVSIYLADPDSIPLRNHVYTEYILRIRDQINDEHEEITGAVCFSNSDDSWVYDMFLSMTDLFDKSKGFLVNDTLIVELQFISISSVTKFI